MLLPEIISKEPLGPVVRQGDDQWFMIVRWLHFALRQRRGGRRHRGECRGDEGQRRRQHQAPARRRKASSAAGLGLDNAWAANTIKAMGNYGEIFERNIGQSTPIGLPRGVNALWTEGGLQYGPPIR